MRPNSNRSAQAFLRNAEGNFLALFALTAIPLVGFVGGAMDYSRASALRDRLHRAADSAALVAAKDRTASLAQKETMGRQAFDSSLGNATGIANPWFKLTEIPSGVRIEAGGDITNRFMSIVGLKSSAVATMAEAVSIMNPTEVALVLDNTGSMKNDMAALRKSATQFTDTLFNNATGAQLKIAVVPYVAAVNPGAGVLSTAWLDTGANSRWHGQHLRNRTIGDMVNCNSNPFPQPPSVAGGGGGGSTEPPGPQDTEPKGNDRTGSRALESLSKLALELFGIKAAHAQVTPATDLPNSGQDVTPGSPYRTDGGTSKVPTGFQYYAPCWLGNPSKISHFDLFNRVSGARWKGCVEARPEPYDVTDEPPSGFNPDTLFVPYFWPDEPRQAGTLPYSNSYLDDGPLPPGWTGGDDWKLFANLFKYDTRTPATFSESPPRTTGPNAACPDAILPLTNQKSAVTAKINGLMQWEGGGTISSEGVMWGWRVLSPGPPFTEGAAYDQAKKYLVLMTDGQNSFVANQTGGPTKSDYTAYGYLRDGRLPSDWFSKGEQYLDQRMRLACQNAKQTGIKILTILFRETGATTQQLLRDCASDPKYAYLASNDVELRRAFDEVAGEISRLRLSK